MSASDDTPGTRPWQVARYGHPPLPFNLGMEFVGEVIDAGPGAEAWVGRRVMGSGAGAIGAHAEQVVGPADMAFNVPPELPGADRSTIGRVVVQIGPPASS
jgi:NADPH:quinone reductase-like Zn-dependent oxidoreductase